MVILKTELREILSNLVYLKFLPAFGCCAERISLLTVKDTSFPGDNSGLEPPESISNSEVKQTSADDSVGFPHVKVGHRQGFIKKKF